MCKRHCAIDNTLARAHYTYLRTHTHTHSEPTHTHSATLTVVGCCVFPRRTAALRNAQLPDWQPTCWPSAPAAAQSSARGMAWRIFASSHLRLQHSVRLHLQLQDKRHTHIYARTRTLCAQIWPPRPPQPSHTSRLHNKTCELHTAALVTMFTWHKGYQARCAPPSITLSLSLSFPQYRGKAAQRGHAPPPNPPTDEATEGEGGGKGEAQTCPDRPPLLPP